MWSNLQKTKRKLTVVFTIMVYFLILFLWLIYFSWKYLRDASFEEEQFNNFFNILEQNEINFNDYKNWINRIRKQKFIKWEKIGENITQIQEVNIEREFRPNEFINYLLLNKNNEILWSDIKDEISLLMINDILANEWYYSLLRKWDFLVKKIFLKDTWNTIIFFKKLQYSFSEYLEDMLSFVIVLIIFSILLYYLWYKFVDEALTPVEENIKDMKDFIHNVWHELKTPLSVMDSNLQIMKELKKYDKDMIIEMKKEVIKLNSLIDSLVDLSDINAFKNLSEIKLNDIVREVVNDFNLKIKEKNINITCEIQEKFSIKANRDYLYMFLANIIWNAIKYNQSNWNLEIICKSSSLIIKDFWIWIEKKDINKIFDRFYKADKSRNTPWFGIWLSLVKKIADTYKWKLTLKSEKWKWTEFVVKF